MSAVMTALALLCLGQEVSQSLEKPGWLGIRYVDLDRSSKTGVNHGAIITEVTPYSPASASHLQVGDIITKADDQPIRKSGDLATFIQDGKPGTWHKLRVYRKSEDGLTKLSVHVRLVTFPVPKEKKPPLGRRKPRRIGAEKQSPIKQLQAKKDLKPSDEKTGGFRGVPWGARRQQCLDLIGATEGSLSSPADDEVLAYKGAVAGLAVDIGYCFNDGVLTRGIYLSREHHSGHNLYVLDYRKLQELLRRKYGEPVIDEVVWLETLWKDSPEQLGMAVGAGAARLTSSWWLQDTFIELTLQGDNYKLTLGIQYLSSAHVDLMTDKKEQAELEGL